MQENTSTATNSIFKEFFDIFQGEKTESTYTEDYPADTGMYLTKAEVQQLQEVLRDVLSKCEGREITCFYMAKECKSNRQPYYTKYYYTEAAKARKKINSLARIQAKLKHKLLTVG